MKKREIIQLDARDRASLGPYARGDKTFIIEVDDDGVITLTPAVILPVPALRTTPIVPPWKQGSATVPAQAA